MGEIDGTYYLGLKDTERKWWCWWVFFLFPPYESPFKNIKLQNVLSYSCQFPHTHLPKTSLLKGKRIGTNWVENRERIMIIIIIWYLLKTHHINAPYSLKPTLHYLIVYSPQSNFQVLHSILFWSLAFALIFFQKVLLPTHPPTQPSLD